ncbi:MAG TPA: response regulator [Actinomycetota bacterium]|jgi:CheY-like chemotaxis protein|nr:response regulator [Actinomycetota bacterium]
MGAVGTPTRVLVVDDEPQVVWMLQFGLEADGYETIAARDGVAALEAVRAHRPNVVLLDVMMPVLDGWSVLETLRSLPERDRPRVVVLSARASRDDRAKAEELGADAFVAKPFNVDDVLGVVRELGSGD